MDAQNQLREEKGIKESSDSEMIISIRQEGHGGNSTRESQSSRE